jgi:hypothetical protein
VPRFRKVVVPVISINKEPPKRCGSSRCGADTRFSEHHFHGAAGDSALPACSRLTTSFKLGQSVSGSTAQNGDLISDMQEIPFDLTSENPRDREIKTQLVLSSAADAFNNQQVILKLEVRIQNTAHFQEYKSQQYTLRRSFTSDFDFE